MGGGEVFPFKIRYNFKRANDLKLVDLTLGAAYNF